MLSPLTRLYVYALHGCAIEVVYTALWDIFYFGSLKSHGVTSIWAMLIYGTSVFLVEKMHVPLRALGIPLALRAVLYTLWTFLWEFSTGFVLRQFNACPWDYAPWFTYHFHGLVTLEYAPLWYAASIACEKFLIRLTLELTWKPSGTHRGGGEKEA